MPPGERLGSRESRLLVREVARQSVSVVIYGDAYAGEFGMCELWALDDTKNLRATRCCLIGRCWWPGVLEAVRNSLAHLAALCGDLVFWFPILFIREV